MTAFAGKAARLSRARPSPHPRALQTPAGAAHWHSRGVAAKRLSGRRWGGLMLDTHLYFGCPYFSRMAGRLLVTRLLAHT